VVTLARALVDANRRLFDEPRTVVALKTSPYDVEVHSFDDEAAEAAWVLEDLQRDREANGHRWGDVALLYRTNRMGGALEAEFLRAGVPCRMAQGRALADDPVVAYLIAALNVIMQPGDPAREAEFMRGVLPSTLFSEALARAEARDNEVMRQLNQIARERPKGSEDAKKIRRAQYELQNLWTLARRHTRLDTLVQELLSQRVGQYRSILEERHDELSDPASNREVVALADALLAAAAAQRPVRFEPMGGLEIALRGMLAGARQRALLVDRPHELGPLVIGPDAVPSLGVALGLFKALQYNATREFTDIFRDFTTFDIESTGKDPKRDRIIEVAAVRVRDGRIVDEFAQLVNPGVPIPPGSTAVHHITNDMVRAAPSFEAVWPTLREFLGKDVVVAHNGYDYDFPLLRRHVAALHEPVRLTIYDTLPLARELHPGSRKLEELAHALDVPTGTAHRALEDARVLAMVFPRLNALKLSRARKTALSSVLDQLGVALALSESLGEEATRMLETARLFSFSNHSDCLDYYERERAASGDAALPTVEQLIDRLGGAMLMSRVRAAKDANTRYPVTMSRLRRLLDDLPPELPLAGQVRRFLQTVVLSRHEGTDTDRNRVNLLTLHSTKGLEFSRVYIVGVSDNDLLTGAPDKQSQEDIEEARRLLYVGMTRTQDRLVMTRAAVRDSKTCDLLTFLAQMGVV
jgi:DNA polymerase III epsilon subunit family exonuclease